MKSSLFLSDVVPDVARIAHSFAACFLKPLVQFILVLIESIAAFPGPRKHAQTNLLFGICSQHHWYFHHINDSRITEKRCPLSNC
jgi:hypothetical protein